MGQQTRVGCAIHTASFLICPWSRIGLVKANPKSLLALATGEGRVNVGWYHGHMLGMPGVDQFGVPLC